MTRHLHVVPTPRPHLTIVDGDLGEEQEEITFEPLTEPVVVPETVPAQPEPVPA